MCQGHSRNGPNLVEQSADTNQTFRLERSGVERSAKEGGNEEETVQEIYVNCNRTVFHWLCSQYTILVDRSMCEFGDTPAH